MKKASYEIDMVNGPLFGKILRFSIPLMLSGILQLLFNAADIIVVGQFTGSHAMAAVGSTGSLNNLIINIFIGLSTGSSVLMAMYYFNPTFNFVACDELKMPQEYKDFCEQHGIKYTETTDFSEDVINSSDIIYMTRVQRERFTDLMEYERVKNLYTLHNSMLDGSKDNVRVLHPLPRVNEISQDVDDNPKAYYFQQAQNGLYARQAIICKVLGIDINKEA